ncbi:MAG: helix-turn-helix domain-containing protein [Pseudonocardiaceae bacterium]
MSDDKPKPRKPLAPLDPALFEPPEMRAALAACDVTGVYRRLTGAGVSQHQIARRTGQSQSEVCEIVAGRRVRMRDVLVRICDGLGVPRWLMGLSHYGPDGRGYAGSVEGVPVAEAPEGASEAMKRRAVVGALSVAVIGEPLLRSGEQLVDLILSADEPLPSRLEMPHVHIVRSAIERLRDLARQYGGQADLFAAAVRQYTRWLHLPGTDAVKARFAAALSELHTETGWCCYDAGVDGRGYFTRAARLADGAGDVFGIVNAAWHAGATMVRGGHPDDALKCFQLGQFQLMGHAKPRSATVGRDDPRTQTVAAWLHLNSATAYALMDCPEEAKNFLAKARENWDPPGVFERAGIDRATAAIQLDIGRFDTGEQFAQSAVRTYGDAHRRGRILADLTLAELNVRAGEPRGIPLARHAIDGVSTLLSAAARRERLVPLADALDGRPGGDARELARVARKVAATRA